MKLKDLGELAMIAALAMPPQRFGDGGVQRAGAGRLHPMRAGSKKKLREARISERRGR